MSLPPHLPPLQGSGKMSAGQADLCQAPPRTWGEQSERWLKMPCLILVSPTCGIACTTCSATVSDPVSFVPYRRSVPFQNFWLRRSGSLNAAFGLRIPRRPASMPELPRLACALTASISSISWPRRMLKLIAKSNQINTRSAVQGVVVGGSACELRQARNSF